MKNYTLYYHAGDVRIRQFYTFYYTARKLFFRQRSASTMTTLQAVHEIKVINRFIMHGLKNVVINIYIFYIFTVFKPYKILA